MKLFQFINQELHAIAEKEIRKSFNEEMIPGPIEKISTLNINEDFENIDEIVECINKDNDLSTLDNYKSLVVLGDSHPTKEFFDLIRTKLELEPKNKLYQLFWVSLKANLLVDEEHFDIDVASFLDDLFQKYDYLINLDDLFTKLYLLTQLMNDDSLEKSKELFIPVFEKAANKYPNKLEIKEILAKLYFADANFEKSILVLHNIKDFVDTKCKKLDEIHFDSFLYIDYLDVIELLAMNYDKLEDYDKVLEYANYVMSNLPLIFWGDGEESDDVFSYMHSCFLRMRVNMMRDNVKEVKDDYSKAKGNAVLKSWDLNWGSWENEYADVLGYIKINKL